MKNWRVVLGISLIYLLSIFGGVWVILELTPSVEAAQEAPPTLTVCLKVSEVTTKAGLLIEDFRCEDQDEDYVFYKNSLGFAWNKGEQ